MRTPVSDTQSSKFWQALISYYQQNGRHDMLWRQPDADGMFDPYKIMVSELMLQQTQVDRVTPKYHAFLEEFPTVDKLAQAELGDVLRLWNGLGYNRRAKYIWQAARMVMSDFEGQFPDTYAGLIRLPGVGPNTAGAILTYAYNHPAIFIETNIRTVIIHHFFAGLSDVPDTAVREVLEAVVQNGESGEPLSPREFYWAMMDYGTYLKKTVGNLNKASRHYTRQSRLEGSRRQIRGHVIRLLTVGPSTLQELSKEIPDERLEAVVDALIREEMVVKEADELRLG